VRDPASSPGPGVRVPHPIEVESYAILRSRLDTADLPPLTRAVGERVVHTSADPSWAGDLVCDEAALRAGRAALLAGAPLVTDVRMVAVGVTARTSTVGLELADEVGDRAHLQLVRVEHEVLQVALRQGA
jgi:precorrin isomerase